MQYCEDPNQSGSYYPPKIIDKSKIESGECPQIDDNFDDIEMVDENDDNRRDRGRRDRDRCKNCPYCESEVSFYFSSCCLLCQEHCSTKWPNFGL